MVVLFVIFSAGLAVFFLVVWVSFEFIVTVLILFGFSFLLEAFGARFDDAGNANNDKNISLRESG